MKYSIFINGDQISPDQIDAWEARRLAVVSKKLAITFPRADMSLDDKRTFLSKEKQAFGYPNLLRTLRTGLRLSALSAKVMTAASFGHRKAALTEFLVDGMSASEVDSGIEQLMLESTPEHEAANLGACPDHHALRSLPGGRLEVIETTGGSPFPIQFFIEYGKESGLITPRDSTYPYQSVGVASLEDGTVIGGVRHQFRDEGDGFRARLAVEFPYATPGYFIHQHQFHLACEFRRWFEWILAERLKH